MCLSQSSLNFMVSFNHTVASVCFGGPVHCPFSFNAKRKKFTTKIEEEYNRLDRIFHYMTCIGNHTTASFLKIFF